MKTDALRLMSPQNGLKPEYICGAWDDIAQDMFQSYWDTSLSMSFENNSREPEEVARLVEEIIRSDNPHIRYQNGDNDRYVRIKVVDTTGDSTFEAHSGVFQ